MFIVYNNELSSQVDISDHKLPEAYYHNTRHIRIRETSRENESYVVYGSPTPSLERNNDPLYATNQTFKMFLIVHSTVVTLCVVVKTGPPANFLCVSLDVLNTTSRALIIRVCIVHFLLQLKLSDMLLLEVDCFQK